MVKTLAVYEKSTDWLPLLYGTLERQKRQIHSEHNKHKKAYLVSNIVIQCGEYFEEFTRGSRGFVLNPTQICGPKNRGSQEYLEKSSENTLQRIRRLALCNSQVGPTRFLTLTYKEKVFDVKRTDKDLKNFCKKYKRTYGEPLLYLGVYERHKSGVIHIHALTFNKTYLTYKDWEKLWGKGIVDIRRVWNNPLHIANYMTKYMRKADIVSFNGRKYRFSMSLKRPVKHYSYSVARMKLIKEKQIHQKFGEVTYKLWRQQSFT